MYHFGPLAAQADRDLFSYFHPTRRASARSEASHAGADHPEAPGGGVRAGPRSQDAGGVPEARDHRADVLPLAQGVRRSGARPGQASEGAREGELPATAPAARYARHMAEPHSPDRRFFDLWSGFYDALLIQRLTRRPEHGALLRGLRRVALPDPLAAVTWSRR